MDRSDRHSVLGQHPELGFLVEVDDVTAARLHGDKLLAGDEPAHAGHSLDWSSARSRRNCRCRLVALALLPMELAAGRTRGTSCLPCAMKLSDDRISSMRRSKSADTINTVTT
jgi:hypothetical protein